MLPVYDIDRQFRFADANVVDYGKLFISIFFIAGLLFLVVKHSDKREKSRRQFYA